MDETVLIQPNPKKTADYKAVFAHLLAEMDRVGERMDKDRAEIERLKIETQILKAESDLIKARTQERLDALMALG
jgi:hypothetical protein